MWPFTRRIEVVHKIDRLDEILDRMFPKPAALPQEAAAKPLPEADLLFQAWANQTPMPAMKRAHMMALWQIALGRRPPDGEWTVGRARATLASEGAPLPT